LSQPILDLISGGFNNRILYNAIYVVENSVLNNLYTKPARFINRGWIKRILQYI